MGRRGYYREHVTKFYPILYYYKFNTEGKYKIIGKGYNGIFWDSPLLPFQVSYPQISKVVHNKNDKER